MELLIYRIRTQKWSLFFLIIIGVYLFLMFRFDLWNYGGVSHMEPLFADTHIVLAASDCNSKGYDVYRENPCDAHNRPHCYSRLWLCARVFGLTLQHTNIIGGFLAAAFLSLSVLIVRPQNFLQFIFFSMLIFSPSIMLGVERGNMDLLIFIMITIAGFMILSKILLFRLIAFLILLLTTFLKFYPVASFGIFVHTFKAKITFWLTALFTFLIVGIFFAATYSDFLQLNNNIPRPSGWLSFGVASFYRSTISGKWLTLSTLLTIFILIAMAFKLSPRTAISKSPAEPLSKTFFLLGVFNLTFCFFVNTNYDYRSIFFILTIPYIFELLQYQNTKLFTKRLLYLFFAFLAVTLWFDFIRHALEFLGKITGKNEIAGYLTWIFFALKQLGSWGSITILVALAIDLLRKPLIEKLPDIDTVNNLIKSAK